MIRFLLYMGMLLVSSLGFSQAPSVPMDSTTQHFNADYLSRLTQFKPSLNQSFLLSSNFQAPQVLPYHFGAICRWENQGNQDHKMPMRFRLGSLSYVNRLEQQYLVKWDPKKVPYHQLDR